MLPIAAIGLWLAGSFPANDSWWVDREALAWVAEQRNLLLDILFAETTRIGSLSVLVPVAVVLVVILLWRGRYSDALLLGLGLGGAAIGSKLLKALIGRPRPTLYDSVIDLPGDGSFPSGHTIHAAAFALTLLCLARGPAWRHRPSFSAAVRQGSAKHEADSRVRGEPHGSPLP